MPTSATSKNRRDRGRPLRQRVRAVLDRPVPARRPHVGPRAVKQPLSRYAHESPQAGRRTCKAAPNPLWTHADRPGLRVRRRRGLSTGRPEGHGVDEA
ncbi:hypothetical protein GCM10009551_073090 [Nocardiopsis tropica]